MIYMIARVNLSNSRGETFLKKIFSVLSIIIFTFLMMPILSLAHPGNTDANGGHYCWTNCEKWGLSYGEYHYPNGGGSSGSTGTSETDNNSSLFSEETISKATLVSAQEKLQETEEENGQLKSKINDLNEEMTLLNKTIDDYKSKEKNIKQKEKDLTKAQDEITKREKEVEQQTIDNNNKINSMEDKLDKKQNEIEGMQNDTAVGAGSAAAILGGGYGIIRLIKRSKNRE